MHFAARAALSVGGRRASSSVPALSRLAELVLVRHGESEGNIAHKRSLRGDHALYENPFFARRHSSLWRLTNRGIEEAVQAGDWLRANIDTNFDRFYVSEYVRAMETAAKLALPSALWYAETFLRERDLGIFDLMSHRERQTKFAEELKRRERDRFFFAPPGGESLADVCLRVDRVINTLHRECAGKRVIIVCHGEVMWAFRIRLERIGQVQYRELESQANMHDHIHNCQVLHYSRTAPDGTVAPYFTHMRSTCPWDLSRSRNSWEEIQRPQYDSLQLMQQVVRVHRIIDDDAGADRLSRASESKRAQLKRDELLAHAAAGAAPDVAAAAQAALKPPSQISVIEAHVEGASMFTGADAAAAHPDAWVPSRVVSSPGIAAARALRALGGGAPAAPASTAPSLGASAGAPQPRVVEPKPRPLHLKRVVVVGKSTRLDRVGSAALNAGDALASRLRDAHVRHSSALEALGAALAAEGLGVTMVGIQNVRPDVLAGADLVLCAGGDGTFLSTAAHVPPHVPVLGINTDPERSTGALTALNFEVEGGSEALKSALERLRSGSYALVPRRRLLISIRPVGGSEYLLPRLALNDVFVSERNSGRVYACEMASDQGPVRVRRSSGLIFSTGTGAGARLRNQMRVDSSFVKHVLAEAAARGSVVGAAAGAPAREAWAPGEAPPAGWPSDAECVSIAEAWSAKWTLEPDDCRFLYSILEPMVPDCEARSRAGVADWMVIKSLGHNTVLTLDGFYEHPIRYGDELTVAVGDADSAIMSVALPGHDTYTPRRGRAWRDM